MNKCLRHFTIQNILFFFFHWQKELLQKSLNWIFNTVIVYLHWQSDKKIGFIVA